MNFNQYQNGVLEFCYISRNRIQRGIKFENMLMFCEPDRNKALLGLTKVYFEQLIFTVN